MEDSSQINVNKQSKGQIMQDFVYHVSLPGG